MEQYTPLGYSKLWWQAAEGAGVQPDLAGQGEREPRLPLLGQPGRGPGGQRLLGDSPRDHVKILEMHFLWSFPLRGRGILN